MTESDAKRYLFEHAHMPDSQIGREIDYCMSQYHDLAPRVYGNVGAGVAVAGAFSLVRFRSVPGPAKEIGTIFLAMSAGLVAGMGCLGYAVLFALILGGIMLLLNVTRFGEKKRRMQRGFCT